MISGIENSLFSRWNGAVDDVPELIRTEEELDELMTAPGRLLLESIRNLRSPLVLLGASGKMGPTLAVLACRAAELAGHPLNVVAVSRFSEANAQAWLEERGVETVACDLFERDAVARLPDTANLVYLVGFKFGTGDNPHLTWGVNTVIPAHVAERFKGSRIVVLSTGNVYPFVPTTSGGAVEDSALTPVGEYANAAVARERVFEYFARKHGTSMVFLRLNYAVDLRYGVLLDIAQKVWAGRPVDVSMGYLNCIWQGDANEMVLRAVELARTPPRALNLTGPQVLSVRALAVRFGELMGKPARVIGVEAETALLSNTALARSLLGEPATRLEEIVKWTAHWVMLGGRTLNKPTHFEVRNGRY